MMRRTVLPALLATAVLGGCSPGPEAAEPRDSGRSAEAESPDEPTDEERAAAMAEEACELLKGRFRTTGGGLNAMVDLYDEAHDLFSDAEDLDDRYENLADATRGARDNSAAVARAISQQLKLSDIEALSDEMGGYGQRVAAGCQALGVAVPATAFDQ